MQTSGINVISGTVYEDSGVSNVNTGLTFVTGGTVTASMASTVNSALAASNAAAALSATAGITNQNGAISLSGQSLTIKAVTNLSENVLYISSLSLLNSTLTTPGLQINLAWLYASSVAGGVLIAVYGLAIAGEC